MAFYKSIIIARTNGLREMKGKVSEILLGLLGTLVFLLILLPFVLIWIPNKILLSHEYSYLFDIRRYRYIGLLPIFFGAVVFIHCSIRFIFVARGNPIPFTPTKALIVTGFYRFVRNPLYIAGFSVLAGEALLFQSLGILAYGLFMLLLFNLLVRMEETILLEKYGAAYEQYRNSVPRWIPRLRPYKGNSAKSL